MKRLYRHLRKFLGNEDGSPAVEFAFVAPLLILMMVASIELGLILFSTILMESGLRDAARYGITGNEVPGLTRLERIVEIVSERTIGLIDMEEADVQVLVYPGFDTIGNGEDFIDGDGNGSYDAGETFTDSNGNGSWDEDIGVAGAGDSGDIVVYRMQYDWGLLTPLAGTVIGSGGIFPIEASIAVRNEPWETEL